MSKETISTNIWAEGFAPSERSGKGWSSTKAYAADKKRIGEIHQIEDRNLDRDSRTIWPGKKWQLEYAGADDHGYKSYFKTPELKAYEASIA